MKIIAYYRVSTGRQAKSGLGIAGQRSAVAAFAAEHKATIVAEYTETESGRKSGRPKLAEAIAHARLSRAKLVVAKLDRLSRNVAFLAQLMEGKADFVACDNPHATPLTLHILAAMAEHECKAISDRTTSALRQAKRRGVQLGSARPGHWNGLEHRRAAGAKLGCKRAAEAHRRAAAEAYEFLMPGMRQRRERGDSFAAIAAWLNDAGHVTRAGSPWSAVSVMRVLSR